MTPNPAEARATYEDLRRLPEDVHAEIDGGVIVTPSANPRHNRLAYLLERDLDTGCGGAGFAALHDVDVPWADGSVTRPDVLVVTQAAAGATELPLREVPVVVVEVLSPSSALREFVAKPRLAAAGGVPEYWVVDPEGHEVARHALVDGAYHSEIVTPGEEVVVDTLPFAYELRPDVLGVPLVTRSDEDR